MIKVNEIELQLLKDAHEKGWWDFQNENVSCEDSFNEFLFDNHITTQIKIDMAIQTQEPGLSLTKENFWNEMMQKYPHSMAQFCEFIDWYKRHVSWDDLFRPGDDSPFLKFHDIPFLMQIGIVSAFFVRYNVPPNMAKLSTDYTAAKDKIETHMMLMEAVFTEHKY